MEEKQNESKKKSNIIVSVLKYTGKGLLTILLILSIVFHLPWKVIALLAFFLAATTILPIHLRKWFWLAGASAALILIVWILLPENNTSWRPYTFDKETSAFKNKFTVPDEENAALAYKEIFETLNTDVNQPNYFTTSNPSSLDEFWLAKEHPEMAEWIENFRHSIERLINISIEDKCIFPIGITPETQSDSLETLPIIRNCVFLIISSANNDIAEKRYDDAFVKYQCCFKISEHQYQQPMLPQIMSSYGIKDKILYMINRFIIEKQPDKTQLDVISNHINNEIENKWNSDWLRMLEYDKLFGKNTIACMTYEINTEGKIRFGRLPLFFNENFLENPLPHTYLSLRLGKIWALLRWFYVPSKPQQLNDIIELAFVKYYKMAETDFDWNKQNKEKSGINVNYLSYIRFLMDQNEYYYRQIHQAYLQHLTLLRGSKILIAIRQYKNENDKWPESLEEIKSNIPEEAFIDPATGEQLQYENEGEQFSLSGELIKIWPFE